MNIAQEAGPGKQDPHSFSRPDEVSVRHMDLNLEVDFKAKRLIGICSLYLSPHTARHLVVDTLDLVIKRVSAGELGTEVTFILGNQVEFLGQSLTIDLPIGAEVVHIEYETHGQRGALQWLDSTQTARGLHPFLFTQSQTVFARSWIPCQDTPAVRATYCARVAVPEGTIALMSAQNPIVPSRNGNYEFQSKRPIPSYLFALAVVDLEFRALGQRSGVYAEPPVLEEAAHEFADIEVMIRAAEGLYGDYRWGRFDLLVPPQSFPFGGMENPYLTFVTPTLIVGDRSLTSVVAHELAHAWSGNLVTNKTWNDFWLNEGLTVYTEHRIIEQLYGKDYDDMLVVIAFRSLKKEIDRLPPRDTWLHLKLKGRNPNDCLTDIPYEKGYLFLRMIEEHVGRKRWDNFLNRYFKTYAFKSIDSACFVGFLHEHLIGDSRDLREQLGIEEWIYGPGLPKNCPQVTSVELERVDREIERFHDNIPANELQTDGWTAHHWVYFLTELEAWLKPIDIEELDATFHFSRSKNSEIVCKWVLLCLSANYQRINGLLEEFLIAHGRLKYLKPIYSRLMKTPQGQQQAQRIYRKARSNYHAVVVQTIDEIISSRERRPTSQVSTCNS